MPSASAAPSSHREREPWWLLAIVIPLAIVAVLASVPVLRRALGLPDFNYDTETPQMLVAGIPIGVVVLVALLLVVRWSRTVAQGPRTRWTTPVWLAVGLYLLFGVVTFATTARGGGSLDVTLLAGVLVACLLVGANEELAFRGLSLNGFARRLPVFWAVLASSLLFGVAHTVNLLSGSEPALVARQVVFATCGGLLFGWVYVFSGRNLWLVALVHGLHDFFVVAPMTVAGSVVSTAGGIDAVMNWASGWVTSMVSVGLPLALTYWGWHDYRGASLQEALGLVAPAETDAAPAAAEAPGV